MSHIKGIFFDAAGVFYDRAVTTSAFAKKLLEAERYRLELTEDEQRQQEAWRIQATEGRISHEEYWDRVLKLHRVADPIKRSAMGKQIIEHVHDVFAYPDAESTMAALKERGFILGIVTDTIYPVEWKMSWLTKVGVAKYIDIVSCSSSLGAHKPEPEMYLNALNQARLTPAQAAFVGHDARELEGGRQAGLTTVAVNYDPQAQADYYCGSLASLLNVPIFQNKDLTN